MNYYEHHLGDYLRDTAHLSMLEDGAYRRMLDVYYVKELPLPAEPRDVFRLVRANSKPERDAVQIVLREFFVLAADGWRHKRCDAEIARFQDKQAKAKRSAETRWSAHRSQSEGNADANADDMRTHSEGNAPRARPQSPVTSNQTPIPKHQERAHTPAVTASDACKAMKTAGMADVSPANPKLKALLDAGITVDELTAAALDAVQRQKGFAYALATAEGRRRDGNVAPLPGHRAAPTGETAYQRTQRERMQQWAPEIAARAPGQPPITIETEALDVAPRRLG